MGGAPPDGLAVAYQLLPDVEAFGPAACDDGATPRAGTSVPGFAEPPSPWFDGTGWCPGRRRLAL